MHPLPFTYHRATSVEDAIALLSEHGEQGKLLAGGHSLLPVMKLRLAQPAHLIDISSLDGLSDVTATSDGVEIGALVTHHQLDTSDVLRREHPLLAQIAHVVGDQQVRNRGTIGGALAHADPAADYPAGVLALDATVVARGPNGAREIPIDEFFVGFLTTALQPNEVVTAVHLPRLAERTGVSYQKLANPASGYAIVGIAAVVTRGENDAIADLRLGITGVGDTAYRPIAVEDTLRGSVFAPDALKSAAGSVTDGIDVLADVHAPADYRATVARNLTVRAIQRAWEGIEN